MSHRGADRAPGLPGGRAMNLRAGLPEPAPIRTTLPRFDRVRYPGETSTRGSGREHEPSTRFPFLLDTVGFGYRRPDEYRDQRRPGSLL